MASLPIRTSSTRESVASALIARWPQRVPQPGKAHIGAASDGMRCVPLEFAFVRNERMATEGDPVNASEHSVSSGGKPLLRSTATARNAMIRPAHVGANASGLQISQAKARSASSISVAELKLRQVAKMREICEALIAEGYVSLDDQAAALGLPRSTTWTIVKGTHKSSGLSATVIARMLSSPRLKPTVRKKILEYIEEKSAGHYGGNKERLLKFEDRVKPDDEEA